MESVVLVIHLILALAIIGLVLLQRSEGGGLGIGGGGGGLGGLSTAKGTANALTKMTAIFATCFFVTSLVLGILAGRHSNEAGLIEAVRDAAPVEASIEEGDIVPPVAPAPEQEIPSAPAPEVQTIPEAPINTE